MRNDSAMNPGRLHLEPKAPYHWGDDHTDTMAAKAEAMRHGIDVGPPASYVPQHRRSARGIVFGVVLGGVVWLIIALFAAWAWRHYYGL